MQISPSKCFYSASSESSVVKKGVEHEQTGRVYLRLFAVAVLLLSKTSVYC